MGSRRKGRELALQMLFQWDLSKGSFQAVRDTFWSLNTSVDEEGRGFADHLAWGTIENIDRIDVLLARYAEHWRVARMATVDRNVLRLGTYELLYETQTPQAVIINEALEIARKFSTPESIHFINGILDSIRKEEMSAMSNDLGENS
jgi:transcription antitermination protein NusB